MGFHIIKFFDNIASEYTNCMSSNKKRRALVFVGVLLLIIIGLPLIVIGVSFIGRVTPDSVIPGSFDLYVDIPNPSRLARRVLNHEALPDIMALPELTPFTPVLNQVKDLRIGENRLFRLIASRKLNAALLPEGQLLSAWDVGVMSPLLRFLPAVAARFAVPGLYHVQAGRHSRLEYRQQDGMVFFIGAYKNLLIVSNNSGLFESIIAGSSHSGGNPGEKKLSSENHDIAFLLSPQALMSLLANSDPQLLSAIQLLNFPEHIEANLSLLPNQLRLQLVSPLDSNNPALRTIIESNSQGTPLSGLIPNTAQYLTLLSSGSLEDLFNALAAINPGIGNAIRRADSTARMTLGLSLEELLFSWTGTQFALYGLEGRSNPVIALEIRDEHKRREVFDKAFQSIFVSENIQLNLDGHRIPRIQLPGFLDSLLSLMGISIPSPYYTIQNNYLYISESAETLLAALNAVRRNEVLPGTDLWRTLSVDNSGPTSFGLFYSLDRSLPFFLRGMNEAAAILRVYRQGLVRLHLENRQLSVSLAVIPGAGKGVIPLQGYPLDLSGTAQRRIGNQLYSISSGRDTRLLLTRGSDVLVVNPAVNPTNPTDQSIIELNFPGTNIHALPFAGSGSSGAADSSGAAAWIINSQGYLSLVNKDLEHLAGFPISTGINLSAPPAAHGGKLYISGEDGSVHTVDARASISSWGLSYVAALRSPPSFLEFQNRSYAAVYPKSFLGEIFVLNADGHPLRGWPVFVPGIAFGSPLLFSARYPARQNRLFAAFITQAGELAVYTENAEVLQGFPIELEGIFYLQPVFDGEYLWIIESNGMLYQVGLNGEVLSQKIPNVSIREEGYIMVAYNSGDKDGEIFFSGEGNAFFGYSRHFNSLAGFPLPVWGRPVFGDINGDRKTELAGVGMDNRLYVWQFR